MGLLFEHWFTDEFKDFKFEKKYIRPYEYSIEERVVNALWYLARKYGTHPESLRLNQTKLTELKLALGHRFDYKFVGPLGYTYLMAK